MYARPQISGLPARFGVSGRLWRHALVLFDRETCSLWSQVDGKALAGPLAGRELAEIPSEVTTWDTWRKRHPDTRVLVHPGRPASPYRDYQASPTRLGVGGPSPDADPRLPPKELVFGFAEGDDAVAVSVEAARRAGGVHLSAGGRPLAVVAPAGEATVVAFERSSGGRELRFECLSRERSRLRDTATGSTWDGATGGGAWPDRSPAKASPARPAGSSTGGSGRASIRGAGSLHQEAGVSGRDARAPRQIRPVSAPLSRSPARARPR